MRSLVLVVPGRLDTRTGGYLYDRRMAEGLRQRGWSVEVRELDDSFPFPTPDALRHAELVLDGIPDGTRVLVDGLALGAMPDAIDHARSRLRVVALVHLPLSADVGLDPHTAARLATIERRALAAAALVVATGWAALSLLDPLEIPREKVVVVEPGTDRAPLAIRPEGTTLQLLTVATLNPAKGHDILLQALAAVDGRDWHLSCAGSLTRHALTVDRIRAQVRELHFENRVSFLGDLGAEQLEACYAGADVFVLASLQETYGMAVAEALAHGLPVVATTTGAIPDLVRNEAGLLAPPGDTRALADALRRMMEDKDLRARLAEGARRVRERLPGWDRAVEKMDAALERVSANG